MSDKNFPFKFTSLVEEDFNVPEKPEWNIYDTCLAIILLSICAVIQTNISYFYADYANGFGLTDSQYSYFIIAVQMGRATSITFTPLNDYIFINSVQIVLFYGILGSISAALIPISVFMDDTTYLIIWCCVLLWIYGNCWGLLANTIFHIASIYAVDSKRAISYLMFYRALMTILYLPISYMIADVNIYMPFLVLSGCLITMTLIVIVGRWMTKFSNTLYENVSVNSEASNIFTSLKCIMNSKECRLLYISIFAIGISYGMWINVLASLWLEEVYGWSTTKVGWLSFLLCIPEFIAIMFMCTVAYKINLFVLNFTIYSWQACVVGVVFVLCKVIGDGIGGSWVAVLVIIDFYFMFRLEYYLHLLATVKYRPPGNGERTALVALSSFESVGICIGLVMTAMIWKEGSGLVLIALISFFCYATVILCWIIIYKNSNNEEYMYEIVPDEISQIEES